MQTVVLMPSAKKFMSKIAPPYLTNYFGEILPDQVLIIFCRINIVAELWIMLAGFIDYLRLLSVSRIRFIQRKKQEKSKKKERT